MCCKKVNLYLPPSLHNFDQLGVDPSLLQSTTPKKLKGAPEPFYLQNLQRKTYPTLLIGDVNYCFTEQNGPSRYYYSKVLVLNVDKYKDCCYWNLPLRFLTQERFEQLVTRPTQFKAGEFCFLQIWIIFSVLVCVWWFHTLNIFRHHGSGKPAPVWQESHFYSEKSKDQEEKKIKLVRRWGEDILWEWRPVWILCVFPGLCLDQWFSTWYLAWNFRWMSLTNVNVQASQVSDTDSGGELGGKVGE